MTTSTRPPHGEHCHSSGVCACADYYFKRVLDRCPDAEVTFAYDMWVGCGIECEHGNWHGTSLGLCGGLAQSIQMAWAKMDRDHPPEEA